MYIKLEDFKNKLKRDQLNHIFILSSPLVVFISKMIIEKYKIPKEKIVLISYRNTNIDLLKGRILNHKLNIFDKVFRKLFLFSLYGYRLRKKIEKNYNNFIFYCDWDHRDVIELLNSKNCLGQAYIEEGQSVFNNFRIYQFKKNRFAQWLRLKRWKKSSDMKDKYCYDTHSFNEFYNNQAFGFFTISSDAFPLINKNKKIFLNNFSFLLKSYKPKLIGIHSIGLICSPRRIKDNNWHFAIKSVLENLPNKSAIKLHPEFYTNSNLIEKFVKIFDQLKKNKEVVICSPSVIIEAEMLFEKKKLYGPLTSLKKYATDFGSEFINIKLY